MKQSHEYTVIAKEERLKQSHDKKQIATAFIKKPRNDGRKKETDCHSFYKKPRNDETIKKLP